MKKFLPILFFVLFCTEGVAQTTVFAKADSVAELYPHHSLKDLKVLSMKLTESFATDEGKFRAIYKWVCSNIEVDYELAELNLKKRSTLKGEELEKFTKQFSARTMRVLFSKHKTVCTGYAYLVRELARYAGLPCEIVDGYGRSISSNIGGEGFANHSWNAVLLNGKWYLCDPTWSAGAFSTVTKTFIRRFEECYFLAEPALFIRNHYPLDKTWTLLEEPPSLEIFLNAPLIYVNAFRYNVHPAAPEKFKVSAARGEKISFVLQNKGSDKPGRVKFIVANGISRSNVPRGEAGYAVDHTFSRRGVFAVHFTVDDQYVASYEVTVR